MDPDRTPVVVAAAQHTEREVDTSAIRLAEEVSAQALAQAPGVARRIGRCSLVGVLSPVPAQPATQLAARLGLTPHTCETTTIGGNTPQWLVSRAARDVASGHLDAVLVVGSEAMRTALSGALAPDTLVGGAPGEDSIVGDARPGLSAAEEAAGLLMPGHVYPLFESVLAARAGRSFAEHTRFLGPLMARFSAVAAKNPYAWFTEGRTATEISTPSDRNRLTAEPYTKLMNAFLGVDQASAVVVCSLGVAQAVGVADRAVFVWSGADANDVWFPTARPDLGASAGFRAAAEAALAGAGVGVDDIGILDLYSCFPVAVETAAAALAVALDDPRGLTVTGGLPYFGGPGNEYTLHAIVTATEAARENGALALVSGLGWYQTKHSVGVYGPAPPPKGFVAADTAAAQAAIDATAVNVAASGRGPAVVDAATVVYDRRGSVASAPVIARLADGRRIVAAVDSEDRNDSLAGQSLVGARVHVNGDPPRYRIE